MLQINYREASSYIAAGGTPPTIVYHPNPPTIVPQSVKLTLTTPPPPPLSNEIPTMPLFDATALRDDLQVVHPPSPNEQDWVMATGNETSIDNVLAISLVYGGRLASMGYYYRLQQIYYYAIMHKYEGPVFLKPNPYTYQELIKVARFFNSEV
uniref:Uncharacterized protein n=1 Tax=Panagrolaimus davidi TaxID=227884 RepID=A0A914QTA4_9BILA